MAIYDSLSEMIEAVERGDHLKPTPKPQHATRSRLPLVYTTGSRATPSERPLQPPQRTLQPSSIPAAPTLPTSSGERVELLHAFLKYLCKSAHEWLRESGITFGYSVPYELFRHAEQDVWDCYSDYRHGITMPDEAVTALEEVLRTHLGRLTNYSNSLTRHLETAVNSDFGFQNYLKEIDHD